MKEKPGKIKFASTAKPNFYALALEGELGIKFNHIPYNGAGETIPAILGNHADFTLVGPGEVTGQVQGGALKILGVMSEEKIDGLNDIPTLKELGYNVSSGTWRGIAVPKGTSIEIKNKLEIAFKNAIKSEEFKKFMKNSNYGIKYLSGEEFKIFVKKDTQNIDKVIKMIN